MWPHTALREPETSRESGDVSLRGGIDVFHAFNTQTREIRRQRQYIILVALFPYGQPLFPALGC